MPINVKYNYNRNQETITATAEKKGDSNLSTLAGYVANNEIYLLEINVSEGFTTKDAIKFISSVQHSVRKELQKDINLDEFF